MAVVTMFEGLTASL